MSYIAPDGVISILKNIPLDAGYRNTISFQSASEQLGYFLNPTRVKLTLTEQYYTRLEAGVLRIRIYDNDEHISGADYLRDCNYLAWCNNEHLDTTGYSRKWFYAFITGVFYVNNEVAEVHFQLDVMQTWMFNYQLKESLVLREHAATDAIGENIVPEPLDVSNYDMEWLEMNQTGGGSLSRHAPYLDTFTGGWSVVVWATFDSKLADYNAQVCGGMYNGLCANVFVNRSGNVNVAGSVNNWLNRVVEEGKEDGIVAMMMFPTNFLGISASTSGLIDSYMMSSLTTERFITVQRMPSWGVNKGIRNNKLYTYPYTMITAQSHNGDTINFRYEDFPELEQIQFEIRCALSPNAQADLSAVNYDGAVGLNCAERLVITDFPQCAYNTDAYKAWMAQNGVSIGISTVSSLLNTAASAFTAAQFVAGGTSLYGWNVSEHMNQAGQLTQSASQNYMQRGATGAQMFNRANASGLVGNIIGSATTIANNANAMRLASIQPPSARGAQSNILDVAYGRFGFYLYQSHVDLDVAYVIDDYFTRYGYATNRLKVPNTRARQRWTYVKTDGCNLVPVINNGLPADDMETIARIYDKGITFWRYVTNIDVGNYSLDNNPLGEDDGFIIIYPQFRQIKAGETFTVSATVGTAQLDGEGVYWEWSMPELVFQNRTWDATNGVSVLTLRAEDDIEPAQNYYVTAQNSIHTNVRATCTLLTVTPVTPSADVKITTSQEYYPCICGYWIQLPITVTLGDIGNDGLLTAVTAKDTGTNATPGVSIEVSEKSKPAGNNLVTNYVYHVKCHTYALPGKYNIRFISQQDSSVYLDVELRLTSNNMTARNIRKSLFKTTATPVRNADNSVEYWYQVITDDNYNMAYGRIGSTVATQYDWPKLRETTNKGVIKDMIEVDGTTDDAVIVRTIDNLASDNARAVVYITDHLLESLKEDDVSGEMEAVTVTYPKGFNPTFS